MNTQTLQSLLEISAQSIAGITYLQGEEKEKTVTYRELLQRAKGLLGHFQEKGLQSGDQLILLVNSNERFIDAFWACILGGVIPVPLATGISANHKQKIFGVFEKLRSPYIYTSAEHISRLKDHAESHGKGDVLARLQNRSVLTDNIQALSKDGELYQASPEDIALIQFSSGSTSIPKGVTLTHSNLLANIEAMALGAKLSPADSTLGWMPLTHDMGLIGFHLVPLATELHQYLMPTDIFVRRPMLWMEKINHHKATVTCSPNFGYKHFLQYFKEDQTERWNLSHLRLILNGAEPISAPLCKEFLTKMEAYQMSKSVMFPVYGLAEASLAATFPEPGSGLQSLYVNRKQLGIGETIEALSANAEDALELVLLGSPVKHCKVSICDQQQATLPPDHVGEVIITGSNVTKGYYNDPEANEKLIIESGVRTGDLGFMHDGQLIICGRQKDIIFINGQNYYPHDLEYALDGTPGLELGKTVACAVQKEGSSTESLAIFVLHKGTIKEFQPVISKITTLLNQHAGVVIDNIIPVRKIPKTTSGKVQRYLLSQEYASGAFGAVEKEISQAVATEEDRSEEATGDVEATLLAICQEFLQDKQVGIHDNLFELGTSSLVLTQIHDRIDEIWPEKLELTDYFDYPTIAELAVYIDQEN